MKHEIKAGDKVMIDKKEIKKIVSSISTLLRTSVLTTGDDWDQNGMSLTMWVHNITEHGDVFCFAMRGIRGVYRVKAK